VTATSTHPAVDLRTSRVAVVMQDRPVVALTSWLTDVIRSCAGHGRGLQLVTPATSRLTTALYGALDGPDTRWVVHSPEGHHDGRTGRPLAWDGEAFTTVESPSLASAYTSGPPAPAWHHTIALQIRHPATTTLLLGGALEQITTTLTGQRPAGWGAAEPATQPWHREGFTDLCRQRAPRRTWLCTVGLPAPGARLSGPLLATTVVSRTPTAVLETVRCTIVHSQPLQAADLTPLMTTLAGAFDIRQALVQQYPGEPDTTRTAHWTGLSTPLALLAGPEATGGRPDRELVGIGELDHTRMGESRWYELRDTGEDPARSWNRLEQVMMHLVLPGGNPEQKGTKTGAITHGPSRSAHP
jgi:uncharacterized protein DUF6177